MVSYVHITVLEHGSYSPFLHVISQIFRPSKWSLPDASGESETIVVSEDALANDEAFEMVRNIVGYKELSGSILVGQFSSSFRSHTLATQEQLQSALTRLKKKSGS